MAEKKFWTKVRIRNARADRSRRVLYDFVLISWNYLVDIAENGPLQVAALCNRRDLAPRFHSLECSVVLHAETFINHDKVPSMVDERLIACTSQRRHHQRIRENSGRPSAPRTGPSPCHEATVFPLLRYVESTRMPQRLCDPLVNESRRGDENQAAERLAALGDGKALL